MKHSEIFRDLADMKWLVNVHTFWMFYNKKLVEGADDTLSRNTPYYFAFHLFLTDPKSSDLVVFMVLIAVVFVVYYKTMI